MPYAKKCIDCQKTTEQNGATRCQGCAYKKGGWGLGEDRSVAPADGLGGITWADREGGWLRGQVYVRFVGR
jgi:hypothetical protein